MKHKLIFNVLMSFITSGLVSVVLLTINRGFVAGFVGMWLKSWFFSFITALISVVFFGPRVQRLLNIFFKTDQQQNVRVFTRKNTGSSKLV